MLGIPRATRTTQKRVKVRGRVSVRHTEGDEDHAEEG